MIIKRSDNVISKMGTPTFFTKVGAKVSKIPIMRLYQGVAQNLGKMR